MLSGSTSVFIAFSVSSSRKLISHPRLLAPILIISLEQPFAKALSLNFSLQILLPYQLHFLKVSLELQHRSVLLVHQLQKDFFHHMFWFNICFSNSISMANSGFHDSFINVVFFHKFNLLNTMFIRIHSIIQIV